MITNFLILLICGIVLAKLFHRAAKRNKNVEYYQDQVIFPITRNQIESYNIQRNEPTLYKGIKCTMFWNSSKFGTYNKSK